MSKTNVASFQAEGILPRQSISYHASGLVIDQALHEWKDGDKRQPPGSKGELTVLWEQE